MSKMVSLRRLLSYSRKYKTDYYLGTLYSILNKFFDVMPEILIGIAIDIVVNKETSFVAKMGLVDPFQQIMVIAILTFFIWVFESLFEYLFNLRWRGLAQKIQHELRIECYSHVQSLDLALFESRTTGGLVSVLNDDINQLERFLNDGANSLIQVFTTIILVGGVFIAISPILALISFLPIPVILIGAFYFQKRAEPLYAKVRGTVSDLTSRLTTNLTGLPTIKSFVTEGFENSKIKSLSENYNLSNQEAIRVSSAFIPLIRMAILSGFIATFILGAHLTLRGELNVGLYGVLVFLTQRLLWPITGLATTLDLFERAMASVNRILDLLNLPITIQNRPGAVTAFQTPPSLSVKNLNFSYINSQPTLKDINLEIPFGRTIAMVGTTGSGKSTLAKLFLRFYEPQSGSLSINGLELKDYDMAFLRRQIGFVSQEPFLFDGSILENIRYGSPHATFDEVIEVAKQAHIHHFVESLEKSYDTQIGERGQKLSGGQKQRLALARTLLKRPPILILDEATSAVDNETESLIQKSILSMKNTRTIILIAHRLSTVTHSDQIYVLENGSIRESGSHAELLKKNQTYAKLWNLQVRDGLDLE